MHQSRTAYMRILTLTIVGTSSSGLQLSSPGGHLIHTSLPFNVLWTLHPYHVRRDPWCSPHDHHGSSLCRCLRKRKHRWTSQPSPLPLERRREIHPCSTRFLRCVRSSSEHHSTITLILLNAHCFSTSPSAQTTSQTPIPQASQCKPSAAPLP